MFQYFATLEDRDIAAILDAVQPWCRTHRVDIESPEGRSALAAAVDHVQSTGTSTDLQSVLSNFSDAGLRSTDAQSDEKGSRRHP
jgi:hypothetical protein